MTGREIIKHVMNQKELKNADLANMLHISQATLWERLNNSKTRDIPLSTFCEMLSIMNYELIVAPRGSINQTKEVVKVSVEIKNNEKKQLKPSTDDRIDKPSTNRQSRIYWELDGERKSAKEWCEQYHVQYGMVVRRMNEYGLSLKQALTFPKAKIPFNKYGTCMEQWMAAGLLPDTTKRDEHLVTNEKPDTSEKVQSPSATFNLDELLGEHHDS